MQRPMTCANRGDEIGENDPSHPTGIFGGFEDCSCLLKPGRATLGGLATGSRSPLNWRLTETLGALAAIPAPIVGSAKNGIRPTENSAIPVIPNARPAEFHGQSISPSRDAVAAQQRRITTTRHGASGRNKDRAQHLSWRTAILSPSPRAWPFNVGRSRYADRLRPNFFWTLTFLQPNFCLCPTRIASRRHGAIHAGDHVVAYCAIERCDSRRGALAQRNESAGPLTVSADVRSVCARAGALCGRRTGPG